MKNIVGQLNSEIGLSPSQRKTLCGSLDTLADGAKTSDSTLTVASVIDVAHQNYLARNYDLASFAKQGIMPTGQFTEGGPMFYIMNDGKREITQNPYMHIIRP
jgi:hypothetical protein